jgi:hypothetical protein
MTLKLSKIEAETVIEWFEYTHAESQHYGNGLVMFPFEKMLVDKLNAAQEGGIVDISDNEVVTIYNWMEKAIDKDFGTQTYLLPIEDLLYKKLNKALEEIEKDSGNTK